MHTIGADPVNCIQLQAMFDLCNERYFNGTLQPSADFSVNYFQSQRQLGRFRYCRETHLDLGIEVASRLKDHPRALRSALVHEMIFMLAHQSFRETGDASFLDEEPLYGHLFIEPGLGAFFLAQMDYLNLAFPELCLTVKPRFGSGSLFDQNRIPSARLLAVYLNRDEDTGLLYRLHPRATTEWQRLRETAHQCEGNGEILLLRVSGALAEDFPILRKDNRPRGNHYPAFISDFDIVVQEIRDHRLTAEITDTCQHGGTQDFYRQLACWSPETYSGY